MFPHSVSHLSDPAVLDRIRELHRKGNGITAQLLVCMAEADERRLYAAAAYSSMYAWCVAELNLSEDAACDRIDAAKIGRQFPALLSAVADGRLHLTAVLMLRRHLTPENVGELIEAATHRSKTQIAAMLAERYPRPDWATRVVVPAIESVPSSPTAFDAGVTVGAPIDPDGSPVQERNVLSVPERIEPVPTSRRALLSPGRIGHQFTVSEDWQKKLERLKDLAIRRAAGRDIVEVLEYAMDLAIAQLEKRKFAATDRPRGSKPNTSLDPRHIPADVKRAVYARDGGQCTYVSDDGHSCESRRVEFDHIDLVAKGGKPTVDKLRLRCRAHNQYAAECTFGAGFMNEKRERARARRANARARALESRRAEERAETAALEKARAECATPEEARAHLDRVWSLLDHAAAANPSLSARGLP